MHRPTIIFLLSHKIITVQQKTTNRNNQSNQIIKKTIPATIQSKTTKNKPSKQTRQTISSINRKINHKKTTTNNPHNLSKKHAQNKT